MRKWPELIRCAELQTNFVPNPENDGFFFLSCFDYYGKYQPHDIMLFSNFFERTVIYSTKKTYHNLSH